MGVEPDSSAEKAGLMRGDVIRELTRQPVNSVKDFEKVSIGLRKGENLLILMTGEATPYSSAQWCEYRQEVGCLSGANRRSWRHDNFNAAVFLVTEGLIRSRRVCQFESVRNHKGRVDLPLFDALQERRQIFVHMSLPHLECEALVHRCTERDFI